MSAEEASDKIKFIRKVYAILSCQLILTAAMIGAVQYSTSFNKFTRSNQGLVYACCFGAIASMCAIMCCFGRMVPHNFILLTIFTACEGYMVAGLTAFYPKETVLLAGLSTALVTIALTVYALYTKTDIEIFYAMTFVLCIAMIPVAIIGFFIHTQFLHILYCCLGLLFYSIYLIIDTM